MTHPNCKGLSSTHTIGLGDSESWLKIYIGNQPNPPENSSLTDFRSLKPGDITDWVSSNSNHWRKIFNITAKLMFELSPNDAQTWQQYRDESLLHSGRGHALFFSAPQCIPLAQEWRLITGKQYAEQLGLLSLCTELGNGFFLSEKHRLIVTPYFDYRQLSNKKVSFLAALIQRLLRDS